MTNKKLFGLFFVAGLGIFFFYKKEAPHTVKKETVQAVIPQPVRRGIDQNRKPLDRIPASTSYLNTPSPDWEKHLETSLKAQAGSSLKNIKIQKEKSLVWMRDENPLHVESVIITMTTTQEVQSSFRALVDSQSGKVLESWDRSIFDPANVRGGFRIKLDPRYSN